MLGLLKTLLMFVPNLLSHYEQKSFTTSSEGLMTVATAIGAVLTYFKVVPAADFQTALLPALVYILGRLLSKAAAPHPASVAPAATGPVVDFPAKSD